MSGIFENLGLGDSL